MEIIEYIKCRLQSLQEMKKDPEIIAQERISAKIELCIEILAQFEDKNLFIHNISLRDFFASQSMSGIMASLNSEESHKTFANLSDMTLGESLKDAISRISYNIADSMIQKR